ncbi:hypothetical protein Bca101_057820 [Brassica carinata]
MAKDHRTWLADDLFDMEALILGLGRIKEAMKVHGLAGLFRDQTWTVVREKHREDRGHGKMCDEWADHVNCVILVAYCATCELMLA